MTHHKQYSRMSEEAVLLALGRSRLMFVASRLATGVTASSMDATKLTAIHARSWMQKRFGRRTSG